MARNEWWIGKVRDKQIKTDKFINIKQTNQRTSDTHIYIYLLNLTFMTHFGYIFSRSYLLIQDSISPDFVYSN